MVIAGLMCVVQENATAYPGATTATALTPGLRDQSVILVRKGCQAANSNMRNTSCHVAIINNCLVLILVNKIANDRPGAKEHDGETYTLNTLASLYTLHDGSTGIPSAR